MKKKETPAQPKVVPDAVADFFLRPIGTGVLMGMGAALNLTACGYMGAFLSSLGLLFVWSSSSPMLTTLVGREKLTGNFWLYANIVVGNILGAVLIAALFLRGGFVGEEDLAVCREYLNSQTYSEIAIKSFFCGALLYFLFKSWGQSYGVFFAALGAAAISYCGLNHYITDAFYWRLNHWILTPEPFVKLAIAVCGNVLGAIGINFLTKKRAFLL